MPARDRVKRRHSRQYRRHEDKHALRHGLRVNASAADEPAAPANAEGQRADDDRSIIASIAAKWLQLTKVPVALPNDW
jgi:hypothetical protein